MINVITWKVYAGKREYELTEDQYKFVAEQAKQGKSFVWFETFVLSIPHITSMERHIEVKDEVPQLEGPVLDPVIASRRIDAMKKMINFKLTTGMTWEEEEKQRRKLRKQAEMLS